MSELGCTAGPSALHPWERIQEALFKTYIQRYTCYMLIMKRIPRLLHGAAHVQSTRTRTRCRILFIAHEEGYDHFETTKRILIPLRGARRVESRAGRGGPSVALPWEKSITRNGTEEPLASVARRMLSRRGRDARAGDPPCPTARRTLSGESNRIELELGIRKALYDTAMAMSIPRRFTEDPPCPALPRKGR
ncbi:hypothetical protein BDW22DRAFT_1347792 [Trametopsis cervina]|nr:hypothetical protein BDW22DRAFT_1347792 [Trametopsis cervina]